MIVDALLRNANVATMAGADLGVRRRTSIAIRDGFIVWIGDDASLPADWQVAAEHDCAGHWITPGLIDCHTHLVYAGNRADEWEARLGGASYAEIAAKGGGIRSTVAATRAAREVELFAQSIVRASAMVLDGVTTIEIKSGYGLDTATEAKMLRVARSLASYARVSVTTTFLGAHAVPPAYTNRADDYIGMLVHEMLPALHAEGLVDAVDAYCEHIGFTLAQTRRVFEAARQLGLPVKLHAEQLSYMGGAELAAGFSALSADHLEYLSDAGVRAMAAAGTVAVMLPGAYYFLNEKQLPPIAALRRAGVPMAVATDCNPGTSPITSLRTAMNMACVLFGLTPVEVLRGVTTHAAKALGMPDRGVIEVGKRADLAVWAIDSPALLVQQLGFAPLVMSVHNGVVEKLFDLQKAIDTQ